MKHLMSFILGIALTFLLCIINVVLIAIAGFVVKVLNSDDGSFGSYC